MAVGVGVPVPLTNLTSVSAAAHDSIASLPSQAGKLRLRGRVTW